MLYMPCAGLEHFVEQVRQVARQDSTVLLEGETGTGKTRLAHLIHELSPRRQQPFLTIDCDALAARWIKSPMFGNVDRTFPDAADDLTSKLASVGGGTLLLDGVAALPSVLLGKLLKAMAERVFGPAGSDPSVPVRARLIAASNRRLAQQVQAGRFCSDLYAWLNVVRFYLPPLRERPRTIAHLAARFVAECATRNGRPVHGIDAAALCVLETYPWPGNVRELRHVIERAVALCPGPEIQPEELPETVCSAGSTRLNVSRSGPGRARTRAHPGGLATTGQRPRARCRGTRHPPQDPL